MAIEIWQHQSPWATIVIKHTGLWVSCSGIFYYRSRVLNKCHGKTAYINKYGTVQKSHGFGPVLKAKRRLCLIIVFFGKIILIMYHILEYKSLKPISLRKGMVSARDRSPFPILFLLGQRANIYKITWFYRLVFCMISCKPILIQL